MDNNIMSEKEFNEFINSNSTRGGSTFNLKTQNVSKQAREKLANTQYKMLAKQHIKGDIKNAYYNNTKFKNKLNDVCEKLNIIVIA